MYRKLKHQRRGGDHWGAGGGFARDSRVTRSARSGLPWLLVPDQLSCLNLLLDVLRLALGGQGCARRLSG